MRLFIGISCFIHLQSPPLPRQTHCTVCLPHAPGPFSVLPSLEFVPEEKERSRTCAYLSVTVDSTSVILTVIRNRVWHLTMQVVTWD